jgi:hypothetical protein
MNSNLDDETFGITIQKGLVVIQEKLAINKVFNLCLVDRHLDHVLVHMNYSTVHVQDGVSNAIWA